MLKKLKIEQFVIIDTLDLDFKGGLTILTGETGAGKSILLDAMGLILGEPSDPDSIRQGANQSLLEAYIQPPAGHAAWVFLETQGFVLPSDQPFRIHRLMKRGAPDDIKLNDKTIDLDVLKRLGAHLVEIHGQFANQSLLGPENQLHLLDLSGNFPPEILQNVANALRDVHRFTKEMEEEKVFLARHKRELPKIEELVGRFEKMGMDDTFLEDVQADYARLRTAKETSEAFQDVLAQLISANGVVSALGTANNILARQKNLEEDKVGTLKQLLATSLNSARDAVAEMGRLSPEYEIDTKPLARLEKILAELNRIAQEAKIPFDGLYDYYDDMATKLARIKRGRERMQELENLLAQAKSAYRQHAQILTEKRTIAGKALSEAIMQELPPLKLMKAEFEVVVEEDATMEWTELGINKVTFTARMNPGMPFSPISATASGGELARLILAVKVVLQRVQSTPTLVFDEVDTGIGGAAAAAVGERLALLAEGAQVLVITHSPQVASRGDQHLHISKQTDGITTTSSVNALTREQRIDEISRMLAGDELTDESKAAAVRLIDEASSAAHARRANPPQVNSSQ